jgi:hypothetical protein
MTSTATAKARTTTTPTASAPDAWAAKLAKITSRPPIERTYTLRDEDLDGEAEAKLAELGDAEALARKEARAEHDGAFDDDPKAYAAAVEKSVKVNPAVVRAKTAHAKAEKAARAADIKLPLRSIGAKAWSDLLLMHPPTEAQEKLGHEYNLDRFPPALIAACSLDPMTVEDAARIIGGEAQVPENPDLEPDDPDYRLVWRAFPGALPQGEASLLFGLATGINQGARATMGKD